MSEIILPFRTTIHPQISFAETVIRLHAELKRCYAHQRYPIDLLAKDVGLYQESVVNFFQVCVNYYNIMQFNTFGDFEIVFNEFFNHSMLHPLQLNIKQPSNAENIIILLNYNCIDMTERDVFRFLEVLEQIIDRVMHSPDQTIQDICLLKHDEEAEKENLTL